MTEQTVERSEGADRSNPKLADLLASAVAAERPCPEDRFAGRGIVICAGGTRLFTCAWLAIAFLRRTLACTLPIEVWHIGPEEIGPPMRALLEQFDATVVDAISEARRHPVDMLGGWQLKTYALLHCRFREVLLLDADNLPVRDPAFLFDCTPYAETGAMFWPDRVRLRQDNPIWAVSGLAFDPGPSFETGQLVIDKVRHWRALCLADWMNQRHRQFDDMLYGDKDIFYVAWRMIGQSYHLVSHAPRLIEHCFCHRDPDGRLLFQHRNGAKWLLHGNNPRLEGFRFEEECFALLSELRGLWDGAVFNPPERSLAARAMEHDLARQRLFHLHWAGRADGKLTLLPDHRIGDGTGDAVRYWCIADGESELELRLFGSGVLRCALRRRDDGAWRGEAAEGSVTIRTVCDDLSAPGEAASAASDAAWRLVVDVVLREGARVAGEAAALVTLATLADLNDAARRRLGECAAGHSPHRGVAAQALARGETIDGAEPAAPPRLDGAGWQSHTDNLAYRYEPMPRR